MLQILFRSSEETRLGFGADSAADDEGGGDEDEVFDDVLAFEGEADGELGEADAGEQDQGHEGAWHLQEEQGDGGTDEGFDEQAEADEHFPPTEKGHEPGRIDPVDGLGHQILGGAESHGFEGPEPDEDDPEAEAQERDAVARHPVGDDEIQVPPEGFVR